MAFKDKEQQRACWREWYARNKEKECKRVLQRKRSRIRQLEPEINKLKDVPCTDCKNRFPPEAMDFDHIKGEKVKINLYSPDARILKRENLRRN